QIPMKSSQLASNLFQTERKPVPRYPRAKRQGSSLAVANPVHLETARSPAVQFILLPKEHDFLPPLAANHMTAGRRPQHARVGHEQHRVGQGLSAMRA